MHGGWLARVDFLRQFGEFAMIFHAYHTSGIIAFTRLL